MHSLYKRTSVAWVATDDMDGVCEVSYFICDI